MGRKRPDRCLLPLSSHPAHPPTHGPTASAPPRSDPKFCGRMKAKVNPRGGDSREGFRKEYKGKRLSVMKAGGQKWKSLSDAEKASYAPNAKNTEDMVVQQSGGPDASGNSEMSDNSGSEEYDDGYASEEQPSKPAGINSYMEKASRVANANNYSGQAGGPDASSHSEMSDNSGSQEYDDRYDSDGQTFRPKLTISAPVVIVERFSYRCPPAKSG